MHKKYSAAYIRTVDESHIASQVAVIMNKFIQERESENEPIAIYIDYGMTGLKEDNPSLVQLKSDMCESKIKEIYLADLTRVSRDLLQINNFLQMATDCEVIVKLIKYHDHN